MNHPFYATDTITLHHGDCLDVMRHLADNSVDAIVTDPPYGLGFMGKAWDDLPPGEGWARECLRVLKPGGHLLAFGGSRTWHRLAVAVEDAGFEIRDSIAWLYGSGFPKSLDVSKAIDKAAGATREVIGTYTMPADSTAPGFAASGGGGYEGAWGASRAITAPATPDAERWQGWGTALKPAFEPIVVGRKPLAGTVAANVLAHGTGALNIQATRTRRGDGDRTEYGRDRHLPHANTTASLGKFSEVTPYTPNGAGRWPANVVLDDTQAAELDRQSGTSTSKRSARGAGKGETGTYGVWGMAADDTRGHDDQGGASRFFPTFKYQAKAPTRERPKVDGITHPTVKPLELMRWLVRLVTPPGGVVLEPFAGSGATVEACILEGFRCVAIEREAEYLPLILHRIGRTS